eukprot:1137755-Pelagomonas_calceolata.AAC.5
MPGTSRSPIQGAGARSSSSVSDRVELEASEPLSVSSSPKSAHWAGPACADRKRQLMECDVHVACPQTPPQSGQDADARNTAGG